MNSLLPQRAQPDSRLYSVPLFSTSPVNIDLSRTSKRFPQVRVKRTAPSDQLSSMANRVQLPELSQCAIKRSSLYWSNRILKETKELCFKSILHLSLISAVECLGLFWLVFFFLNNTISEITMDIKGFYFSIVPTTKKSETRYQDIQCLMRAPSPCFINGTL